MPRLCLAAVQGGLDSSSSTQEQRSVAMAAGVLAFLRRLQPPDPQLDQLKAANLALQEEHTRSLVNQETRFREQLTELGTQSEQQRRECDQLRFRMEDISREAMVKGAGMDRLQAELEAAHKDSDCVRQKLRQLQDELTSYRQQNSDLMDKLGRKQEEDNENNKQLEEKVKKLESQLQDVQKERDRLDCIRARLEAEREEEMKIVQEALDEAQAEKAAMQAQFEKLRTVNTDREQQLLDDFEWKLREVEQACKKRIADKERGLEEKLNTLTAQLQKQHAAEVTKLKAYEVEVLQLRAISRDQQRTMRGTTRQTEQLQVAEMILKEEVARLKEVLDTEKNYAQTIQIMHDKHMAECERNLQSKLEQQRHNINAQWEERMRTDFSRLKSELEKMHDDEKVSALTAIKQEMEYKLQTTKKDLEDKLQDSLNEMTRLKANLEQKEDTYEKELEKARTNADRDIFDLRRKLDKIDLSYQEQMEKLVEKHEKDIERLNEEADRRVQQLEQNWQLQMSSTRATLELVKEQMERDAQDKMETLREQHRQNLEQQRKKLKSEKEESIKLTEEKHQAQIRKLLEDIEMLQKRHTMKEEELLGAVAELKAQLEAKHREMEGLKMNVDVLEGGLQVLNREITTQGNEIVKVQTKAQNKIREREARLLEVTGKLKKNEEKYKGVIQQMQNNINILSTRLKQVTICQENTKSLPKDIRLISDLRKTLADRDSELRLLTEEKRFYQLELLKQTPKHDYLHNSHPAVGVYDPLQCRYSRRDGGGGEEEFIPQVHVHVPMERFLSSSLPPPGSEVQRDRTFLHHRGQSVEVSRGKQS